MADLNFLLSSLISVSWSSYLQFCLLHCCSLCPRSTGVLVSSISNDSHHKKKKKRELGTFLILYTASSSVYLAGENFCFCLHLPLSDDLIGFIGSWLSSAHFTHWWVWCGCQLVGGHWMSRDTIFGDQWLSGPQLRQQGRLGFVCPIFQEALLGSFTVPRSVREQVLNHKSFSSLCLLHGRNYESLTNTSQCSNSALVWPDALLPES